MNAHLMWSIRFGPSIGPSSHDIDLKGLRLTL